MKLSAPPHRMDGGMPFILDAPVMHASQKYTDSTKYIPKNVTSILCESPTQQAPVIDADGRKVIRDHPISWVMFKPTFLLLR
jgi:hypothetical protein